MFPPNLFHKLRFDTMADYIPNEPGLNTHLLDDEDRGIRM
jgi:hypothetical protein